VDGVREMRLAARIEDLGDLRTEKALETVDATGLFVAPLWDPALKAGDAVALPDFAGERAAHLVAPGEPADLVILRREGEKYRVERVVKYYRDLPQTAERVKTGPAVWRSEAGLGRGIERSPWAHWGELPPAPK
jgi:hypothetical protein